MMIETPNLSYVNEIAGDDQAFVERFLTCFIEEFRLETGMYLRHINRDEPRAAAEMVAHAKYKFVMLGMKNSFTFALSYIESLQSGDATKHAEFLEILETVNDFLIAAYCSKKAINS